MEVKTDIQSRNDISVLVHKFYSKVRENEELGPVFNTIIDDWDKHLEKLTDFWESNLFNSKKYIGNPKKAHIEVDEKYDHAIEQRHFGTWMNLWLQTIDELFEGPKARLAKDRAANMATHLYIKIFQHRKENTRLD